MMMNLGNTVSYVGVTNDLQKRVYQHKNKLVDGFTQKYHVSKLVYYEITNDIKSAITREKQIKSWSRQKKVNLIKSTNPLFRDLSIGLFGQS